MELLGRGYVIDHALSFFRESSKKEAFRNYVADALRFAVNNAAGQDPRMVIKMSYREMVNPASKEAEKENKAKAGDIIARMRGKLKGGR